MQPKYEYRRRLSHYRRTITRCSSHSPRIVAGRWQLPPAARDIALECCVKESGRKFELHAAVVRPDPVHLIDSPLRRSYGWSYSLPEIMKAIKGRSAREINVALKPRQEEFFDRVLRSNDSLVDRVDYVCQNPVRAGLVSTEAE